MTLAFVATPVVVGIDLSMTGTGVATSAGTQIVASTGHKGDTLDVRHRRLADLTERICNLVPPLADLVVIEAPSLGQGRQAGTHDRSGLWWLVVAALLESLQDVVEVPPATLKKYVTGKGNATKDDIRMEIFKRFDVDFRDNNEADAFVLRAIGLDLLGHPLVPMPIAHRAPLEKLPRPSLRGAA